MPETPFARMKRERGEQVKLTLFPIKCGHSGHAHLNDYQHDKQVLVAGGLFVNVVGNVLEPMSRI